VPNVGWEAECVLEGFPSANSFAIKDVGEGVDSPVACRYLVAILVYGIAVPNFPRARVMLFRAIRENGDVCRW
jgi:hypothetical protein